MKLSSHASTAHVQGPSRQTSCPSVQHSFTSSMEQQHPPDEGAVKASARKKKPSRSFLIWLLGRGCGPLPPIFTLPALALDPGPLPGPVESYVEPDRPTFRYWIDFQVLNSPSSAALLERAFRMVGGVCTGGPAKMHKSAAALQKCKDYGYMHMGEWDILWSITAKAMLAAEILRPGQLVGILPGFLCVTRKTSLVRSLRTVYGDACAFTIVPRTFKLPEELDDWADWISKHAHEDTGLWMLKNNKQRGTGLRLVRTSDAFAACFETTQRPGLEGVMLYRWYLAQQYISKPLLIDGCKFGVRVWVLVPELVPLRAYMHVNGLVLFSSQRYDINEAASADAEVAPGHLTNYAQNEDGTVWSLGQLATHMGRGPFGALWQDMQRSTAMVLAAALPRALEGHLWRAMARYAVQLGHCAGSSAAARA
ncbi:tubulin-tyrosine ligase family-domain-containing protein [Dunaliella salina]|uniref:Tubulin--tyrosine ligase-like protein 5 n=1 Tax=Dunaliella salina TaxID=3046 RepID=A0ABQ7GKR3_DUNSA|nr:tubulin-tyrosine ligase family-domain-containing protein [Dunaliella salina]|eukprot:KAF5835207.1 tubulin-tyrosine ligase family-domain-containing protein [Dunaliella salina]